MSMVDTMPGIIITGRGGAGKTTIASNLGVYFTREEGLDTVVIDGDLFLPKLAFHFGIYNPAVNLHSILKDPRANPFSAVYRDPKTGVYVVPGSSNIYESRPEKPGQGSF